jgi:hypothetical protein
MAIAVEEVRQSRFVPRTALCAWVSIKGKLGEFLPLAVIIIGAILTFIWTGGLFWLLASLVEM